MYVDDDAGEGGNGSLEKPFAKIQDAVNASVNGDTVRVWEGLYLGEVVVNRSVSLIGNGSLQSTVAKRQKAYSDPSILIKILSDNVVLEGFFVQQFLYGGTGVKVLGRNSYISQNNVTECEYGIFIYASDNNTIENNNVSSCGEAGIRVTGINNTVVNNTLYDNVWDGILLQGDNKVLCQHNLVVENNCTLNGYGIKLHTTSFNEVRGNNCSDTAVTGIEVAYSEECVILENMVCQNLIGVELRHSNNTYFSYNNITKNEEGIHAEFGGVGNTFRFNWIHSNAYRAVSEISHNDFTLDARYNYWGSNTGPLDQKNNPDGKGNEIINRVDFSPWLDEKGGKHYYKEEKRWIDRPVVGHSVLIAGLISLAFFFFEPFRYALFSLYTRLNPHKIESDIAQQNIRGHIYQFVKDNPGVNLSTIKEEMKLGYGTVVYHLEVLHRERYLRSAVAGLKKQFWTKRDFPTTEEPFLSETQQKIVEALQKAGNLSRAQLSEKTGIARSTLGFNVKQLVELGKVEEEIRGKEKLCSLKLY